MAQERRMKILQAVVEDYIRTQEPVSSSGVASRHHIAVSSATVRNDMASLEDEGYLIKPHTSAGRIPSEKGYRYFVDQLSTIVPLSRPQRRAIEDFLKGSVSIDDVLHRSARLLAQITGQVAVVATPAITRSSLRRCEFIRLGTDTILTVIITDTGGVEQRTLTSSLARRDDFLSCLTQEVNSYCCNLSLRHSAQALQVHQQIILRDCLQAMDPEDPANIRRLSAAVRDCISHLVSIFEDLAHDSESYSLYTTGAAQLAHERHSQVENIASLLDALEEQIVIMHLMDNLAAAAQESGGTGVGVAIGSETHSPELLHTAIVTAGYGLAHPDSDSLEPDYPSASDQDKTDEHDSIAFVGSIGPTHMDYRMTMSAVQAVAQYLTRYLTDRS